MVNLIAAVGKSGQLGLNGLMPWHDSEDLKWFKTQTYAGVLIIGKNTAEKLPPLPNRTIHVMKREESPEEIIHKYHNRVIWVAGGETIYKIWLPYVRRSFITHIDYDGPADTFMPQLWNTNDINITIN